MDKIVRAEVIYDDGNVHIIDFVIDDFVKLSNNTTLIIEEGADIHYISVNDGELANIILNDGIVGTISGVGGTFNMYGGYIGCFMGRQTQHINIYDGTINYGSTGNSPHVIIYGGNFGYRQDGSSDRGLFGTATVYGGNFRGFYGAYSHIYGGQYEWLSATSSAPIYLYGNNFVWTGNGTSGQNGVWDTLSGEWYDGTTFSCYLAYDDPSLIRLISEDRTNPEPCAPVPEPSPILLMGMGLLVLVGIKTRKKWS